MKYRAFGGYCFAPPDGCDPAIVFWKGSDVMRRVIETKQSTRIGQCIYCGTSEGKLSEEHITPYGLSGRLTLLDASCQRCARITSGLENTILRNMFFAARAALGTLTRRPKDRLKPQPMLIEKEGRIQTIKAVWQEQWKVIQLPIFKLPACVDNRLYSGGIECTSMDVFELSERGTEIAARHGAEKVIQHKYQMEDFARFIAKMAYGYAVERYGLKAFEKTYVLPAILGESNDIGRWVGCSDRREFPVRQCNISVGYKIIPGDDLMVKIKMFPRFDGAEYVVVVSKIKKVYRDYIHSRGEQG